VGGGKKGEDSFSRKGLIATTPKGRGREETGQMVGQKGIGGRKTKKTSVQGEKMQLAQGSGHLVECSGQQKKRTVGRKRNNLEPKIKEKNLQEKKNTNCRKKSKKRGNDQTFPVWEGKGEVILHVRSGIGKKYHSWVERKSCLDAKKNQQSASPERGKEPSKKGKGAVKKKKPRPKKKRDPVPGRTKTSAGIQKGEPPPVNR